MWIVQEFLLAPKVLLYCGDEWLWWQDLYESVLTCDTLATISDNHQAFYSALLIS